MNYWQKRALNSQEQISKKSLKQIEAQLKKYYKGAAKKCIEDFEATYDKILATVEAGKQPTPADLYKLDKYWQAQAQMRRELQKLGDKEINFFLRFLKLTSLKSIILLSCQVSRMAVLIRLTQKSLST
jgi:hypothetical protein